MKPMILSLLVLLTSFSAHAKKNCTEESKSKWMAEADFKKKVEGLGYQIRKFKQPGSCYEIYGKNKEGKEVEVYFNPVDASVVKEEVE